MRDGANVAAGGDAHGELRMVALATVDDEFVDLHGYRLEHQVLALACRLVGTSAVDLFGGEGGRGLLEFALKAGRACLNFRIRGHAGGGRRRWHSVCVVGVGGEAEADGSGIGLWHGAEELGETGIFA